LRLEQETKDTGQSLIQELIADTVLPIKAVKVDSRNLQTEESVVMSVSMPASLRLHLTKS
jgi:phosphoribosylcarboxyaminoimidazole (NCAIR) mutase